MDGYPNIDRRANPLTEAQLGLVETETRRAVKRALKTQRRRTMGAFLLLLVGLMLVVGLQQHDDSEAREAIVRSGTIVAVDGCNRDFRNDMRLRRSFQRLKDASTASFEAGRVDFDRYAAAQEFYDREISFLDGPDCRRAASIITSDLDQLRRPVRPLYPGSPEAKRLLKDQ